MGTVEEVLDAVDRCGWASVAGCIGAEDSRRLTQECRAAFESGGFRPAGVGRGTGLEVRGEIRQDQVMWIDPAVLSVEQAAWLVSLEGLRLALNRRFFFGLFEYEGHFAVYPEGAFYKPHLDRHAGKSDRIVTVILYLNEDWQPGDGGELKLWTTPEGREGEFVLVQPRLGTLVCFMSGDFWHEVLPAIKPRMSITGWFRQR